MNIENTKRCEQIRIRAERRAGEILREQEKAKEAAYKGNPGKGKSARRMARPHKFLLNMASPKINPPTDRSSQRFPQEQFEAELEGRPGKRVVASRDYQKQFFLADENRPRLTAFFEQVTAAERVRILEDA